jgi:hypothetical protein
VRRSRPSPQLDGYSRPTYTEQLDDEDDTAHLIKHLSDSVNGDVRGHRSASCALHPARSGDGH